MTSFRAARILVIIIGLLILAGLPAGPAAADSVRNSQWHLGFLRVAEAHRYSEGEGVTVGVIDTGVDGNHPDLSGAVLPGTNLVSELNGWQDVEGHGTAMAGLVAARGRSGARGALGIAPRATILPVNAGVRNGLAMQGIDWAVEHGAAVLCLAFGGSGGGRLEAAVSRAVAANVVVVAAAGNRPQAQQIQAPGRYPGVLTAVGVDAEGRHAAVSVTGPEAMLSAPAVDIWSTGRAGEYRKGTGTSDATAILAGAAALVRAKFPSLTAAEVIHRLTATAIDKGEPGRDEEYGFGVVDLVAALTAEVPPAGAGPSERMGQASSAATSDGGPAAGPLLGWIVGGLLLAAAGVGAIVAVRGTRVRHRRASPPW